MSTGNQTEIQPTELAPAVAFQAPCRTGARFYRPELDLLRFLALLLVFSYHVLPNGPESVTVTLLPKRLGVLLIRCASIGSFGLSLFFTLSAFLICELLLRERDAYRTVRVRDFYIRRILRIWPLYFAGLLISLLITRFSHGSGYAIHWVAWSAFLMGNWYIVIHGQQFLPMEPLWSISVEEQFYLFAPLATKLLNRRQLAGFAIALVVTSNFVLLYLSAAHAPGYAIWRNSFVQFENFAAGILLCLTLHGRCVSLGYFQRALLFGGAATCWIAAICLEYSASEPQGASAMQMIQYALVAAGCCLILLAFLDMESKRLPRSLVYCGRISYGLYVYHILGIHITNFAFHHFRAHYGNLFVPLKVPVAFALTLLCAAASYRYLEAPFLRLKRRYEIIPSRPV